MFLLRMLSLRFLPPPVATLFIFSISTKIVITKTDLYENVSFSFSRSFYLAVTFLYLQGYHTRLSCVISWLFLWLISGVKEYKFHTTSSVLVRQ